MTGNIRKRISTTICPDLHKEAQLKDVSWSDAMDLGVRAMIGSTDVEKHEIQEKIKELKAEIRFLEEKEKKIEEKESKKNDLDNMKTVRSWD